MFKIDKIGIIILIVLAASVGLSIWNKELYHSLDNYRLMVWVIIAVAIFYQLYTNRQKIRSESPKYKDLSILLKIAIWMCVALIAAVAVLLVFGYLVS